MTIEAGDYRIFRQLQRIDRIAQTNHLRFRMQYLNTYRTFLRTRICNNCNKLPSSPLGRTTGRYVIRSTENACRHSRNRIALAWPRDLARPRPARGPSGRGLARPAQPLGGDAAAPGERPEFRHQRRARLLREERCRPRARLPRHDPGRAQLRINSRRHSDSGDAFARAWTRHPRTAAEYPLSLPVGLPVYGPRTARPRRFREERAQGAAR